MSELVVYEQLTLVELDRLTELEAIVEQGLQTFVEVGLALLAIRDERLYRQTHGTFVDYLAERWQMSESQGYRLIDAGRVAELISPIGEIANEAQARELVPLLDDEAELLDTWRELRAEHGDKLTAEKVRAAVDDRLRRDQVLSYMGSSASDEWNTPQEFFAAAVVPHHPRHEVVLVLGRADVHRLEVLPGGRPALDADEPPPVLAERRDVDPGVDVGHAEVVAGLSDSNQPYRRPA